MEPKVLAAWSTPPALPRPFPVGLPAKMRGGPGAGGSAYSALDPAFSQAEIQRAPLWEGISTSPRAIPSYCGSSPLPQAMCVCSYQMQIAFPTLLAASLTPQDPSLAFFFLTSSFCNALRSSQPLLVSPPSDLAML